MSIAESACTYAALVLSEEDIPITTDAIMTLLKAANVKVESYWPALFAKLLEKRSVADLTSSVGTGGGGGAPAAVSAAPAAAAAPAAPAVEEKKEEPKEESDEDMGFSLFD